MEKFTENFFKALARTTRFQFTEDGETSSAPAHWLVAMRALMGVLYALVAQVIIWMAKTHVVGVLLATIAVFALHTWLTAGLEIKMPTTLRKRLFPTLCQDDNQAADTLSNFVPPLLTFLLVVCHGVMWFPAILGLGTAAAAELSGSQENVFAFKYTKSWCMAALFIAIFVLLPTIGCREVFQSFLFRAIILFALAMLLLPWLRQLKSRSQNFSLNCVFTGVLIMALTILIIAF